MRCRSIPACAGEPHALPGKDVAPSVYPRVCGGTRSLRSWRLGLRGLSPRVRGNPPIVAGPKARCRSIPACAGEPSRCPTRVCLLRVYPRVCGGTASRSGEQGIYRGLSPRVRGNHGTPPTPAELWRSIPACAGEPIILRRWGRLGRVYPRVCGGTVGPVVLGTMCSGLSPRVRGNRPDAPAEDAAGRSIPACAGEPHCPLPVSGTARVYPRVCGGTRDRQDAQVRIQEAQARSIPACAGEPKKKTWTMSEAGVYPRVCGGTRATRSPTLRRQGLSPRVRGNLLLPDGGNLDARSIPACAGEPHRTGT